MINRYTVKVGNMFDRFGSILKSYIDDEYAHTNRHSKATKTSREKKSFNDTDSCSNEQFASAKNYTYNAGEGSAHRLIVPRELLVDFTRLGLTSSATLEVCKKNHKRLMIKYHPDKHAANPFALIHAHEISARINMSFQRICKWFSTGRVD